MCINQELFIDAVTEQFITHFIDDSNMDDDDYDNEESGDSDCSDNGSVRNDDDMNMSGLRFYRSN